MCGMFFISWWSCVHVFVQKASSTVDILTGIEASHVPLHSWEVIITWPHTFSTRCCVIVYIIHMCKCVTNILVIFNREMVLRISCN